MTERRQKRIKERQRIEFLKKQIVDNCKGISKVKRNSVHFKSNKYALAGYRHLFQKYPLNFIAGLTMYGGSNVVYIKE